MIPFSDEELLNPVKSSLAKILPMLEKDGGGMEFLGIKNTKVYVRLIGACHGCPSSGQTLKYGVERQLKIDIHPEIEVINIPVDEKFEI
ncbi:MAG: NifU family protein [Campylobacter sputorum]|uniref:NifU family protein n=1 Tax=Campylobacter sputorum TaxID=206 RepID=UPI000B77EE2A|nr:NifU family protein [Campylobacter sputorum]ASM39247.1 NifU domain protein, possible thioredoxin [Campylobacter sputorum bv. paraureolyticus LMG 11764]MDY6121401.1 NifU family protein [Campylobacter sputorum]